MKAKDILQKLWPLEVAVIIIYAMFIIPIVAINRVELFIRVLPLLTTLIGGQGVIAFAGPEIKRYLTLHHQNKEASNE